MVAVIIDFLKNNKKILIWLIPIVLILVGFSGYLNPNWIRVFGDTYPRTYSINNDGFQFFLRDFSESLKPSYYAPYRLFLDESIYYLEAYLNKYQIQWLFVYLPFIISVFLSYFIFYRLSNRNYYGIIIWFFYTFSTFCLFTSSIHTNIITSINLILFFFYLLFNYLVGDQLISNSLKFIFIGSLVITASLILELRMVLVNLPFFIILYILINYFSYLENKNIRKIAKGFIVLIIVSVIIILIFSYLFFNIAAVTEQVGNLTSRNTWGNSYFSLINTLSLSHPFWNNSSPINFVYNYPPFFLYINIVILVIIITNLYKFKNNKAVLLLCAPLFFYLTLSKQNNPPFIGLYEFLYQFPYFSFSREASKYYYGYLLSIVFFIVSYFRLFNYKQKITLVLGIIMIIPALSNFYIFASGRYMNTTRPYTHQISSYSKINNYIESVDRGNDVRIMWLPYKPTLQNDDKNLRHLSYTVIINSFYPFYDIRKESRSFKYESLSDPNFKSYLSLFGVKYVVIPNFDNEPEVLNQLKLLYKEFAEDEFVEYSINSLGLDLISQIDGYKIYSIENNNPDLNIISSNLNSKYQKIGNIDLNNNKETQIQENMSSVIVESGITNCNNDESKGLNFLPKDRIDLAEFRDGQFKIKMTAHYNEVPCVFFKLNSKTDDNDFIANISDFTGSDLELVVYKDDLNFEINKTYILSKDSNGSINITCESKPCVVFLYQYGNNVYKNANSSLLLSFINSRSNLNIIRDDTISVVDLSINTYFGQQFDFSTKSDYLLFRYPYNEHYVIEYDGKKKYPIKNNHNLLLFKNNMKDKSGISNSAVANIYFEVDSSSSKSINFSNYALFFLIILSLLTIFI
jgi:hypothetical protein